MFASFGSALGGHIGTGASELLDGRLNSEQEHRARMHLGSCRTCAALVAAEQQARAALRAAAIPGTLAPSASLVDGLMALAPTPPAPAVAVVQPDLAPTWHRSPRVRSALAVSSLVAAGVTAAFTLGATTSAPTVRRQAGTVARADVALAGTPADQSAAVSERAFIVRNVSQTSGDVDR